jgi:hypothetical protein
VETAGLPAADPDGLPPEVAGEADAAPLEPPGTAGEPAAAPPGFPFTPEPAGAEVAGWPVAPVPAEAEVDGSPAAPEPLAETAGLAGALDPVAPEPQLESSNVKPTKAANERPAQREFGRDPMQPSYDGTFPAVSR